jgi:DNA-binding beta-propeller fold protein YncE
MIPQQFSLAHRNPQDPYAGTQPLLNGFTAIAALVSIMHVVKLRKSGVSKLLTLLCFKLSTVPSAVSQCLPTGLQARYTYDSWDSSTLIWKNTAGLGSDATGSGSGFSNSCRTNVNGASGRVCEISGTTTSVLRFGTMPSSYTICTVARYSGASKQRIFTSESKNWFHGFGESKRGVAYDEAWMTSSSNLIPAIGTDWLVFCGQNQAPNLYYANDLSVGVGLGGTGNFGFGVNTVGGNGYREQSDFAIMEISIWFRPLSEVEIQTVSSIYMAILGGSLTQTFPSICQQPNLQPRNLARSCGTDSNQDCATEQSSVASWWGMNAYVVVDGSKTEEHVGSTGIFYGSHTNTDNYPWIRIDMVTSRAFGSGQIWNRQDNANRLDGFQIWIGDSLTYNGPNNMNCYTATTTQHNYFPYVHYFPCIGSGRYLFISIPRTSTYLHIREIEIYPPCSSGQSAAEPHVLLAHNYNSIRKLAVGTKSVTTVAGNANGISGFGDGVGTLGRFYHPRGLAVSTDGTFALVADLGNKMVRRVNLFTRTVTTVAGSVSAYTVRDGIGTYATFDSPFGVALSPDGLIAVVTEMDAHIVRKITLLTGQVTTLAGLVSSIGSVDGFGTNSRFNCPAYIAISPDGLYALVPEWLNHVIRRLELNNGAVTTLVGTKATYGSVDGLGSTARFNKPCGIAISPDGFFALVTDINNHVIRKVVISTKSVTTVSGAKYLDGSIDGRGTSSRFSYPNSVAISPDGWFAIVTDADGQTIRFITINTGDVNTVAGNLHYTGMADGVGLAAQFYNPEGSAVNRASCSTGLFQVPCSLCSSGTYRTGCTWTSPGICTACSVCPPGQYRSGCAGTSPGSCLCTASSGSYPVILRDGPSCQCGRLEVSYNGMWGTVCDDYFGAADATVVCKQLQLSSGNVMPTASLGSNAIWMDDVSCTGTENSLSSCPFRSWGVHDCSHSEDVSVCCCTMCPSGQYSSGCSGSSSGSCLSCPTCPAGKYRARCMDSSVGYCTSCLVSFALVADTDNHIIRSVQLDSGAVSTLAGTKEVAGSADGTGTRAYFSKPHSVVISPDGGSAYVCDTWNHAIRIIIISTGYVDTLAGSKGTSGSVDGVWTSAQFDSPVGLAISPDGSLIFVADTYNQIIRVISPTTKSVSTLAGGKDVAGSVDGYGIAARFYNPRGIAISPDGTYALVSDTDNFAVRMVVIHSGAVTTLAGVKSTMGSVDGMGSAARFTSVEGLEISPIGQYVLVADHDNHAIRKIDIGSGAVSTLAGSLGISGTTDGTGTFSRFMNPYTVSISTDGLVALVPEFGNHAIRHIELDTNSVTTLAGSPSLFGSQDGVGSTARLNHVRGVHILPTSSKCLSGQFLGECNAASPGACVWCSSCPAGNYRVNCAGLSAGSCQNCPSCNIGQFNYGCDGLFPGSCTECQSCPSGQYVSGCSGIFGGSCNACRSCNVGQYLSGCSGISPGSCLPCATCTSNQYVSGCGGLSPGTCVPCSICPQGQYIIGCTGSSSGVCNACSASCPSGEFRRDCGGADAGICATCESCPGSQVRTGCAETNPGMCVNIDCKVCQVNQFLDGCSGVQSGTCINCGTCPIGQYRKDCGGNSVGICALCESVLCPAGSYRVGCNYTSSGTCSTCGTCPTNQFRSNCSGVWNGMCMACDVCPAGHYRVGCLGTSTGICVGCNPCPAGMFRVQCSGLAEGRCEICNCSDGQFRKNCSGLDGGICVGCGSCPQGQYRSSCNGINPGICMPCEPCIIGKFRDLCGGISGGTCIDCTQCPSTTFCSPAYGQVSCNACDGCPDGNYRQGCGGISGGSCQSCQACSASMYRTNCLGASSGYCEFCSSAPCESEDQYRVGCGGLYIGYCTVCNTCPHGMYRGGCNGTSPGSCYPCLACPNGKQRHGCSGTRAGSCNDCSTPNTYALIADTAANVLHLLTIASQQVENVAGFPGHAGSVDGTGSNAQFFSPVVTAYIPAQKVTKVLLTDRMNHVVRFLDIQSGSVTTLAGLTGSAGMTDGSGTNARFNQPFGLVVSRTGDFAYLSEYAGHTVRSINIKTSVVTTGAGGKGVSGFMDGTGTTTRFFNPCGLALAMNDAHLFLVDSSNHLVRHIDLNTWETNTFVGTAGTQGSADGVGSFVTFSYPQDVSLSPDGIFLFLTDRDNDKLRRIDTRTRATATLKTTPGLTKPSFISLSSDGLYALVSEAGISSIKQIDIYTGFVTLLAGGNPAQGAVLDVVGSILKSPSGITLLPQEPRRIIHIAGSAIEYVNNLSFGFRDGDNLDYQLERSDASFGEAIQTVFSLEDGECVKMVELKANSKKVQGIAFSTSFGRSFSIRGSKYDENGQILVWRSGIRECILGLELDQSISESTQVFKNVIKECMSCLPGTFISRFTNQSGEVEDVCSSCPIGKFSNTSRALQCFQCELGKFSTLGDTACLKCETKPPPMFLTGGTLNSSCIFHETSRYINSNESCLWECKADYYRNADNCLRCTESSALCTVNEYLSSCSPSENAKCKPCFNKPPNAVYTAQGFITSNCSWTCGTNYFFANASCNACNITPCQRDTYAVPCKEYSDRSCVPCTSFKPLNSIYNGIDRNVPEACQWECISGFFCSGISKYASCYEANSSCSPCSNLNCSGFLLSCTVLFDASCVSNPCVGKDNVYYMTPKNLPLGSAGGSCMPCTQVINANRCQAGFYRSKCSQFEDSECVPCINGPENCGKIESGCTFISDGNHENNYSCGWICRPGMHILESSCTNCPAGKYENSGVCTDCLAGQFSSSEASESCQLCGKGKYSIILGASSESVCNMCDAGKYQDVQGVTFCQNCKVNSYSAEVGAISDAVCEPCPEIPVQMTTDGKTGQLYRHNCLCPKRIQGNMSDYYRFNESSTDCLACPRGLKCSGDKRIEVIVKNSVWVLNSSFGFVLEYCPAGYYYKQDLNFFSTFKSLQELQECKPCLKGFDCTNPPCQTCNMCGLGKYKGCDGIDECLACPADTYADTNASLECSRCPVGMSSRGLENRTSIQDCICAENSYAMGDGMDCQICPPGLNCYGNLKEPNPKPLTVSSSLDGQNLESTHVGVSNWSKEMKFWKLVYCPPGYRMLTVPAVDYKDQECVPCGRGEDCSPDYAPCSQCSACAKGKYKSDRYFYQTNVPRSYFSQQDAAFVREWVVEPCESCTQDTYRNREAGTERGSCAPCPARSTTLGKSGRTSIFDCICDSQFYMVNLSANDFECQVCPKGAVCSGRSRTCALRTSPPACPCEDDGGQNLNKCKTTIPGNWIVERVSGRRDSSTMKSVLRISQCPPGYMVFKDDVYPDLDECRKCISGKYSLLPTTQSVNSVGGGSESCRLCPFGAECPGGDEVQSKVGFWRDFGLVNSSLAVIYTCPPGACDTNNKCRKNRTGEICGYCPRGFALTVTGCTMCPESKTVDLARTVVTVLGIVFVLLFWTTIAWCRVGMPLKDSDTESSDELPGSSEIVYLYIPQDLKEKIRPMPKTDLIRVLKEFNLNPNTELISIMSNNLLSNEGSLKHLPVLDRAQTTSGGNYISPRDENSCRQIKLTNQFIIVNVVQCLTDQNSEGRHVDGLKVSKERKLIIQTFELKGHGSADYKYVDFDHFVVEDKIYINRGRFFEELVNSDDGVSPYVLKITCSFRNAGGLDVSSNIPKDPIQKPQIVCTASVWNVIHTVFSKAEEVYLIQYCKIFLTYFQILGAFWTFDVDWPDFLLSTMKWASYIFQFDIFHAPNISCFWAEAPFYLKLMAYTILPFVACCILYLVPLSICWLKTLSPKPVTERKKMKERSMDLFWQSVMVLIFFVYPVVSLTVLQAFDCRPGTDTAGNNGLNRLSIDMRDMCPPWISFVRIWAGFFIIVYPIGLPVIVFCTMHFLRVREIANHAVSSEIIISMIRECIKNCNTPESSRLSTLWAILKSRQPRTDYLQQRDDLSTVSELVSKCIQEFDGKDIFIPNEDEIKGMLNGERKDSRIKNLGSAASGDNVSPTDLLQVEQETLDSWMQREWNTSNLFTGAENGLLPYLTELQLEVLFWWSQIKIFESIYKSNKKYAILNRAMLCTKSDVQSEESAEFKKFKTDSLNKLSKFLHKDQKTESVRSLELYKAVVRNGLQLIKTFNIAYESPVWSKSQPEHKIGHLQVEERKTKSLYSMSMREIEEMRFAALSSVGIVFASYKMEFWYWELIEMFRK